MSNKSFQDGDYEIDEVINSLNDDFVSEKNLCDFIEKNIIQFTKECLGYEYKTHNREYSLYTSAKRSIRGNRRIDFLIITNCGKRIGIECKKPTYISELSSAIGQALSYIALFDYTDTKIDKIFIVSTKIDNVITLVIKRFELPIGYICMDKTKYLKLYTNDK